MFQSPAADRSGVHHFEIAAVYAVQAGNEAIHIRRPALVRFARDVPVAAVVARMMPYFFMAFMMTRVGPEYALVSKAALSRRRNPMGGSAALVFPSRVRGGMDVALVGVVHGEPDGVANLADRGLS